MSLSFASREEFSNEENGWTLYTVQSSRCPYKVTVYEDSVRVVGRGVEEDFDIDEHFAGLSSEGIALIAVIMFEEMERG